MAQETPPESLLDNPVWHALRGPQLRFSVRKSDGDFLAFDPEVSVFSAVDGAEDGVWGRIAEAVGPEGFCGLFRDVVPAPPTGWEEHFRGSCLQMVGGDLPSTSGLELERLGPADVAEMLALTERTEPGPFLARTLELGRYVGLRREGRLVAMAGERFRLPGYVEISAVCTDPDARGEGLARELTLDVAHSIRASGKEAFLHVLENNENAIRLYEKIGFVVRRKVDVVFAQWHGPGWQAADVEVGEPDV